MTILQQHVRHRRAQLHRLSGDAGRPGAGRLRRADGGAGLRFALGLGSHPARRRAELPDHRFAHAADAIAARTKKIKLGTGILVLPLRNPVVLAKQLSSMDQLSDGRLLMGMASGWYKREFDAVGVPFEQARQDHGREPRHPERASGPRTWSKASGTHHKIPAGVMYPKPVQKPRPPILIGGYVDRVLQARRRRRRRLADLFLHAGELREIVGEDAQLRQGRRQGPRHAAQRRAAADHDRASHAPRSRAR